MEARSARTRQDGENLQVVVMPMKGLKGNGKDEKAKVVTEDPERAGRMGPREELEDWP